MAAAPVSNRVSAVDALRGFVMIIMALDHVRDFHSRAAMTFKPEDLAQTTPEVFFTRWITHICAPVFMFTAGLGAYFWMQRHPGKLTSYLWKRGLLLVVLEVTVLRFALFFSLTSGPVLLTVLWALGMSMIALSLLVRLPVRVLAVLSIATILLHNLADGVSGGWLWKVLHQQGVIMAGPIAIMVGYPLIPWIAVMAAGYCFGFVRTPALTLRLGLGMTAGFVLLRFLNVYGDPSPWTTGLLSFLRTTKYPPSLQFLLMTLGPALLLLWWFERLDFRGPRNPLLVFGRTPMFYFLGHFFLAHLLVFPLAYARYGHAEFVWKALPNMGGSGYPPDYGFELGGVYLIWIAVVVLMYPLCLRAARPRSG